MQYDVVFLREGDETVMCIALRTEVNGMKRLFSKAE